MGGCIVESPSPHPMHVRTIRTRRRRKKSIDLSNISVAEPCHGRYRGGPTRAHIEPTTDLRFVNDLDISEQIRSFLPDLCDLYDLPQYLNQVDGCGLV